MQSKIHNVRRSRRNFLSGNHKFGRIGVLAVVAVGCLLALAGCIKNDIPYPRIQPNFLTFNVKGQTKGTQIDTINRKVTVYLPETVNIYEVDVESYTVSEGSHVVGDTLSRPIDLSSPMTVMLEMYQQYEWTISADQPIDRYFELDGQIGTSIIDVPGKRVLASVTDAVGLKNVLVKRIKLGPENGGMSPELQGKTVDFSKPVTVKVSFFGHEQDWVISVVEEEATVTTLRADGWACVGWVSAQAVEGKDNGVEYRLLGDTQWTRVPKSDITFNGGDFLAKIPHLSPETTYETRAYSGEEYGATLQFNTTGTRQLPNSSFDEWWQDGRVWCPWPEGGEQYWDTGNKGATTLGPSNSVPTDDTSSGTGWAAELQTKFVGIGMLGKLAAGNIFVGKYVRTDGTNGILSFGRPFELRPTKVKGYMKYKTAPISSTTTGFADLKGRPDTCIIWCALIDTPEPFEIRTNPNNRQLFDAQGDYVVAYGKIEYGENIDQYIPFEFELTYKDVFRKPKYVVLTASASKYGDYFTGANGAVLYVDDFQLVYDY